MVLILPKASFRNVNMVLILPQRSVSGTWYGSDSSPEKRRSRNVNMVLIHPEMRRMIGFVFLPIRAFTVVMIKVDINLLLIEAFGWCDVTLWYADRRRRKARTYVIVCTCIPLLSL
jgi:hypothetical protein